MTPLSVVIAKSPVPPAPVRLPSSVGSSQKFAAVVFWVVTHLPAANNADLGPGLGFMALFTAAALVLTFGKTSPKQ